MTQPIDIITRAMKDIGAIAAGEVPTADEAQDALDMLNDMCAQWSNENMMVFYRSEIIFQTTQNQVQYTIGPSGQMGATFTGSIAGTTLTIPANGVTAGGVNIGMTLSVRGPEAEGMVADSSRPTTLVIFVARMPSALRAVIPMATITGSRVGFTPRTFANSRNRLC